MSKFEINLRDDELSAIRYEISLYAFPKFVYKEELAEAHFGKISAWNIRKVREAVSRLQSKGYPIIAHHGGYSVFGDDPAPVIEYLNREYHRVHEAQKKNDQIFAALKRRYGDEVALKVEQLPEQPMIGFIEITSRKDTEPVYQKAYSPDGTMHNV